MKRRPWPIVLLALFQLFSPIVSIFLSAYSNKVSFEIMAKAIWMYGTPFERTNFFFVPVFVGIMIFFTKRLGLVLVCLSISYDIINNFLEWRNSHVSSSVWMVVGANLVNISLVAYLLTPRVRKIFWEAEIRWWEHAPRFILNTPAELTIEGENVKHTATLADFSSAGASLDFSHPNLEKGAVVDVQFIYDGMPYFFKAEVVYSRPLQDGVKKFGLRHAETEDMLRLAKHLNSKGVKITRLDTDWKTDFLMWLKSAKSPKAWVPETELDKRNKKNS